MWIWPLYLHVNQKSDDDDDDENLAEVYAIAGQTIFLRLDIVNQDYLAGLLQFFVHMLLSGGEASLMSDQSVSLYDKF